MPTITLPPVIQANHEQTLADERLRVIGELEAATFPALEAAKKYHTIHEPTLQTISRAKTLSAVKDTVLITGPTGSGKDLIARIVGSRQQPFKAINVAGLSASLFQSQLFGYERGAFTGANASGAQGILRAAGKGTVFMDEIGELPFELQHILLRVIENRTIVPVGGTEEIEIACRFIFATNKRLPCDGFRDDLYFRIATFELQTYSLAERGEEEALYIAQKICERENWMPWSGAVPKDWYDRGSVRQLRMMLKRREMGWED